jgi:hypothetical protein
MACSHAAACPLFPLLNASLDGWRRCYCDSRDGWRQCARYQQSLRGQYVPLSLLPNGHDASHLQSAAAGAGAAPSAAGGAPTLVDLLFEHAPAPDASPPRGEQRVPTPTPPAAGRTARPRSWWTRMVDWMRSPA